MKKYILILPLFFTMSSCGNDDDEIIPFNKKPTTGKGKEDPLPPPDPGPDYSEEIKKIAKNQGYESSINQISLYQFIVKKLKEQYSDARKPDFENILSEFSDAIFVEAEVCNEVSSAIKKYLIGLKALDYFILIKRSMAACDICSRNTTRDKETLANCMWVMISNKKEDEKIEQAVGKKIKNCNTANFCICLPCFIIEGAKYLVEKKYV